VLGAGGHAHPHHHPSSAAAPSTTPSGGTVHSPYFDEFRNTKSNAHLTLLDVVKRGVLVELATDQHGSRFIQQRVEMAQEAEKNTAVEAVLPEVLRLAHDVFGNYCLQKFLEFGTPEQRRRLCLALQGHVLELSLQMYGCRVVQKCLDVCSGVTELAGVQAALAAELRGHEMTLVKVSGGHTHVLQATICPRSTFVFPAARLISDGCPFVLSLCVSVRCRINTAITCCKP
jgi:pumilio RNA-binding family